jgi:cell wall-associated NlpC family hydrolase
MFTAWSRVCAATAVGCLLLAPAAHAGGVYFVKPGDTLARISRIFDTTPDRLMEANGLADSRLAIGDRLHIPDPPAGETAAAPPHRDVDPQKVQQALCRTETVYHAVAKGDTLSAIGRRYDVSVDDLLELNNLRLRSRLAIGQRLIVRRTGPRTHVVRRGESLWKIAARYRITEDKLRSLNGGDALAIAPGDRLLLEPCDRLAAAGSVPPPLAVEDSVDFLATVAQTSLQARREAHEVIAATSASESPSVSHRVIELAKTMLNIPYRFGGTTLRGIDCSAYVQRVFSLIDLQLPRTAREQFGLGSRVGRDELSVGDLVFFRTYASFPSHVGIYLGDNLFIHASSVGRRVTIDSLDQRYYSKRFLGGRRLLDDASAVAAAP